MCVLASSAPHTASSDRLPQTFRIPSRGNQSTFPRCFAYSPPRSAPSAPPVRLAPAGPTSDSKPPVASTAASPAAPAPAPAPATVVAAPVPAVAKQDGKGVPAVVLNAPKPKPTSVWKLYPTDDGEDYYYFNEQTGESIWELPESDVQT